MNQTQKKAERLLELHHESELLILPNIWDVLGAKLLESGGFEAIATASASVALSRGQEDDQKVGFQTLLELFQSICSATPLPVTTDIERGYADSLEQLEENVKNLIRAGVVGINIEDSDASGDQMESIEKQSDKIRSIRKVADQMGVPLVINARTDVFLMKEFELNRTSEAVKRGRQYREAGADCFYPILCANDHLEEIVQEVKMPVNVLAQPNTLSMQELERIGVSRLSFGPAVLRLMVARMKEVFTSVKQGTEISEIIDEKLITSKEILSIVQP